MQNYLVFEPIFKCFKTLANSHGVRSGKSKGKFESIKLKASTLTPGMIFSSTKMRLKFYISCLKQDKITFKCNIMLNLCSI